MSRNRTLTLILTVALIALTGCSAASTPTTSHTPSAQAVKPSPSPTPTPAPTGLAPVPSAAILTEVAANLRAADDQIRSQFATGVSEVGTPAGVTWWTTVKLSTSNIALTGDAYKKSQAVFGNYDPAAFDDWLHGALLPLSGDLITWYQAAPGSAEQKAGQAKVEADLGAADADIKLVLSGQVSQI
jgi:hypothetical protein